MELTRTRALGYPVHWLDEASSTNDVLQQRWEADRQLAHGTLIVTDRQTAGRGRQGRRWEMPPHKALAMSLLVRGFDAVAPAWLPLVAGSAVARATRPWLSKRGIGVKWPNDVHTLLTSETDGPRLGAKLSGILCQLLPDGSVIVGVGTNLFLTSDELPTERAGSWLTEGAELGGATSLRDAEGATVADRYLADVVTQTLELVELGQTSPDRLRLLVASDSATLGTAVRAHLPGGESIAGTAEFLDRDGALHIRRDDGTRFSVNAGDIEHLRER